MTNRATGATTRVTQGSGGGSAVTRNPAGAGGGSFAGQTGSGDIYAGHDGNVYKKNGDSWQKYDNGGWSDVQQPTAEQRQAAQDRASQAGSQARDRAEHVGVGLRDCRAAQS